jgi:hypothetical protein
VFLLLQESCAKNLNTKSIGNKTVDQIVDRNRIAMSMDMPPPSSSKLMAYAVTKDNTTHKNVILIGGK